MAPRPSFIPRNYLVKVDFWNQETPEWRPVSTYLEALRSARSQEQHALAFAIFSMRTDRTRSVPDVAAMLGVSRGYLGSKLSGRAPASEDDLIAWAWLTGEERRSYDPDDILTSPSAGVVPRFAVRQS